MVSNLHSTKIKRAHNWASPDNVNKTFFDNRSLCGFKYMIKKKFKEFTDIAVTLLIYTYPLG